VRWVRAYLWSKRVELSSGRNCFPQTIWHGEFLGQQTPGPVFFSFTRTRHQWYYSLTPQSLRTVALRRSAGLQQGVAKLRPFKRILGLLIILLVFAQPLPAQAVIAPEYQPRLLILVEKLTAAGLSPESLNQLFADDRIQLHPEILCRHGKGPQLHGPTLWPPQEELPPERTTRLREYADSLNHIEASSG